jgi:tetratricopeptide (TPR) repeat protein
MNENKHFEEAKLWLERKRPEKAVDKFREALAFEPDNDEIHAHYALCLLWLDKFTEALSEADIAIGLDPEWSFPHYVRANIYMAMKKAKLAEQAIRPAIELDPENATYRGTLAETLNARKEWREAIEAAEAGLELDPEDGTCLSARAFAYIQSGKSAEADLTLETALRHDPDDADLHSMMGWAQLQKSQSTEAIKHYREALKLNPQSQMARSGLVEALKARNFLYRMVLSWFLLLTRLKPQWIFAILIATIFARRILLNAAEAMPALAPLFMTVFWLMVSFILLTWIAVPLFNLVLRFDSLGKHALTSKDIRQTNWLIGSILAVIAFTILWLLKIPAMEHGILISAAMIIPLMTALNANSQRTKLILWGYTAALVLVGAIYLYLQYDYVNWNNAQKRQMEAEYMQQNVDSLFADGKLVAPSTEKLEQLKKAGSNGESMIREEAQRRNMAAGSFGVMFMWGWVAFTWLSGIVLAKDN